MQIGGVSQPGGRSNSRRKPEVEPAEPKDGADASRRLIVGLAGGEIVRRESKRIATGRSEARNSRREPEVRSRSSRYDTTPIRAGELATGRAGVENSRRKSRVLKFGAATRTRQPAKAGGSAAGGAGGCNTVCTASSSRLKRQRLRSLAFSIYGHFGVRLRLCRYGSLSTTLTADLRLTDSPTLTLPATGLH